jgi:hypothetical protein
MCCKATAKELGDLWNVPLLLQDWYHSQGAVETLGSFVGSCPAKILMVGATTLLPLCHSGGGSSRKRVRDTLLSSGAMTAMPGCEKRMRVEHGSEEMTWLNLIRDARQIADLSTTGFGKASGGRSKER